MQIHRYRDIDNTYTDVSAYVSRIEWQSTEKAEEGATGSWTVTVDDPDGVLEFNGHRNWFIEEDDSETDDDIVFGGFVAAQDVLPWPGRPLGRVWQLELTDANTFWQRTIMRGTDCNRPDETDVQRMAWLLATSEAVLVNDKTTYVASTGGIAMDAHDYRGEYLGQIVSDCAMASGRNWFLWYQKQGDGTRDLIAWYQRDTVAEYLSPLYLTNDLADLNVDAVEAGTATVYPVAADTKLRRDPSRVYDGCYMVYEAGATYRHRNATHTAFAHRDISVTQPTVKTAAKAQARADRMLLDLAEQDVRITTAVILPASKVTQLRAGMRTQIRGTHWPDGWDDWHYVRVLEASPEPISVGRQYRVDLELALDTGAASSGPPGPAEPTDGGILYQPGNSGSPATLFQVKWGSTGDAPGTGYGSRPRDAANFSYIGTVPTVEGWTVLNDATLDLVVKISFSDVGGPRTFTLELRHNGSTIATDSYFQPSFGFIGQFLEINVEGLAVAAGDTLTTWLSTSELAGLVVPWGTGDLSNRFEILDTSMIGG